MTIPGPPSVPTRAESLGAYLYPGAVIPGAAELENRVVPFEDLWGAQARYLAEELVSLPDEAARLDHLESALVHRMAQGMEARRLRHLTIDISGVAASIIQSGGQQTIERLAEAAGVSRRHFTRVFRDNAGVSPKIYCELARFRSALGHVRRSHIEWAQVAADCGYTDQSHMIAEFRRFAGLTPDALAQGRWFHPFIEAGFRKAY